MVLRPSHGQCPQLPDARAARLASPPDDRGRTSARRDIADASRPRRPFPLQASGVACVRGALAAPSRRARPHPGARRPPAPVPVLHVAGPEPAGTAAPSFDRRVGGTPVVERAAVRVRLAPGGRAIATGWRSCAGSWRPGRRRRATSQAHSTSRSARSATTSASSPRPESSGSPDGRSAAAPSVHHYQLTDRGRAASILWGVRAALLVTDFERQNGRGDATVRLDPEALAELRALTATYLARVGELGLQTRERRGADEGEAALIQVALLMATDAPRSAVCAEPPRDRRSE